MAKVFPIPEKLIPHRPPMLLLRAILLHEAGRTVCEGVIDPRIAPDGVEISAAFGLELLAQAAAVHHGLRRRTVSGQHISASRGLLLGSRRLRLEVRALTVRQLLRVTIVDGGQPLGASGMIRFEGSIADANGQLLASGDVTVLESPAD